MNEIIDAQKIRNWAIDDSQNRDWAKFLLRLREKKEDEVMEEEVQEVKELTLLQRVEHGLVALGEAIKSIFEAREKESSVEGEEQEAVSLHTEREPQSEDKPMETETKAVTYAVQSFHGNFGKADENAKWSFSAADGNAILDKGGWPLYKQCHLVIDTSDGPTPENKSAYTYPVAKLVDGKPTYFLKSAQTVYAGLRGGARGAKLPAATNEKVLATVKRIYKAFGRDTEKMGLKAGFFYKDDEGRIRFTGGAGSGGGTSGGSGTGATTGYTDEMTARIEKAMIGQPDIVRAAMTNGVSFIQNGLTQKDRNQLNKAKREGLLVIDPSDVFQKRLIVSPSVLLGDKTIDLNTEEMGLKAFFYRDTEGRLRYAGGPGGGGGSAGGATGGSASSGAAGDALSKVRELGARATDIQVKINELVNTRNANSPLEGYYNRAENKRRTGLQAELDKQIEALQTELQPMQAEIQRLVIEMRTPEKALKSHAFAFKAADGADWWMQWTTNAFTDREGENFQTKALEEFVERHRGEKVKGEFWYHHIPGTKFGDVYWQAMVGRFLVQAGPFDNTPVAQAFKAFFSQYPDGHDVIAPEGWGTSHGYQYNASDRKDSVYEWVEIKESTVLPRHTASNPWSPYPRIIQRSKSMNAQEKKELEAIGGKALVDLVTREGEQRTKELEGMGVGFKGLSGAMAKVMALMEGVEDADIKAALSEIYDELQSPDEEELPAPAETELEEGEMAMDEEMPVPMAEAAAGKPDAGCKEAPVDAATRTEVAEAMAALTTELRAEVKATVDAQTKTIVDALTPLLAEVKELRKQDTQKIAEKAAATPAASLRDMVQSVLESQKAQVQDGDPLLARKPQETPFTQRPEGGMPSFLAGMFKE